MKDHTNYGPLQGLIGMWHGDKGMDIAPEPDGFEKNPYHETLTFSPIGGVTNAESQALSVLHYRQIVQRKSNNQIFHDQTGYWMWDETKQIIMHSLTIPRGVCVLAGGSYHANDQLDDTVVLRVVSGVNHEHWKIIQSPFMQEKAQTTDYHHTVTLNADILSYTQTMMLSIYGKTFEHTDENTLVRHA